MAGGSSPGGVAGGRRPGRPRSLSRGEIAEAALDVGMENLSMPAVARRLGISHSTLYGYVTGRDDLVAGAVDLAVRRASWPAADQQWRPLLLAFADALWAWLDRYPGMAEEILNLASTPSSVIDLVVRYGERLHALGFSHREAIVSLDFVADLALSTAVAMRNLDSVRATEQGPRTMRELYRESFAGTSPVLAPLHEDLTWTGRGWFDDKIAIMLDGLEARLAARADPPAPGGSGTVEGPTRPREEGAQRPGGHSSSARSGGETEGRRSS